MSKTPIPAELRQLVVDRADGKCEYCQLSLENSLFKDEVDHIIAEKHGGITEESNLALSCLDCNRSKGSNIASLDPDSPNSKELVRLFNPREDRWEEHFQRDGELIEGITKEGRATVQTLNMNEAPSMSNRIWVEEQAAKQEQESVSSRENIQEPEEDLNYYYGYSP